MRTAFSLQSQLDSAGPGASQNLILGGYWGDIVGIGVVFGNILFLERNGMDFLERLYFWNGTERISWNGYIFGMERNGPERYIPDK